MAQTHLVNSLQEIEKEFTAALRGKDNELELKEKQILHLSSHLESSVEILEAQISFFIYYL